MNLLHRGLLRLVPALLLLASTADATTTAAVNATVTVFSAISFSPAPLVFGNVQLGQSSTKAITLTNKGATTLNFSVALLAGENQSEFTLSNDCAGSLLANASCQLSITFTPTLVGTGSVGVAVSSATRTYNGFVSGVGTNTPTPTPATIALSPMGIQITDDATGGSIASTATVTLSDGSTTTNCTLSTSDGAYYQISGMNVVLRHGLSSADDGQHNTVITVVSCP